MPQIKCPVLHCRRGIVANVYDHEGTCEVCKGTGYIEGEETKAEFQPAFDMPATREQALECLKKWGDPLCATFNAARAKRMWELLNTPNSEAVRKLVEALRHLHHNAKKSGAEMGLALIVAEAAIAAAREAGL